MVRFGVVADAHVAAGKQYSNRFCDLSPGKLRAAVEVFKEEQVDFVVNLGDVIDGAYGEDSAKVDRSNYALARGSLDEFPGPIHHLLGNHDIESLTKPEALRQLGTTDERTWYSFMQGGCTFLVLDANFRADETEYACGNYDWTDTSLSQEQLDWIQTVPQLDPGPVCVFIHQNIDDRLADAGHTQRDPHVIEGADKVRHALEALGRRVIVLQGHYHPGLHRTINGIDYVGLRAMCEGNGPGDNSFAIVRVDDDGSVRIRGYGAQPTYHLPEGPQ